MLLALFPSYDVIDIVKHYESLKVTLKRQDSTVNVSKASKDRKPTNEVESACLSLPVRRLPCGLTADLGGADSVPTFRQRNQQNTAKVVQSSGSVTVTGPPQVRPIWEQHGISPQRPTGTDRQDIHPACLALFCSPHPPPHLWALRLCMRKNEQKHDVRSIHMCMVTILGAGTEGWSCPGSWVVGTRRAVSSVPSGD